MNKCMLLAVGFTLCFFGLGGIAHGADVQKIGIIDLQQVIEKSNPGKRSSLEIKSQGEKMDKILKERGAEIEELMKALREEEKTPVMSDEAREAKEREVREKAGDLKKLQKRYNDVMQELNVNLSKQITKDVFEIVEKLGKAGGYTLIMDRRVGGVVYAPSAIDMTDKVIEKYNAVDAKRDKEKDASGESKKKE